MNKIPDRSLEELTLYGDKLNEEFFQVFVNRQAKLKKLRIPEIRELSVDHIALEELKLHYDKDYKKLAALLKSQLASRRLQCETISCASFNELRKMRHLEVLATDIAEECAGELENLIELKLQGIFRRVVFSKLENFLQTLTYNSMEVEDFISRSSHKL